MPKKLLEKASPKKVEKAAKKPKKSLKSMLDARRKKEPVAKKPEVPKKTHFQKKSAKKTEKKEHTKYSRHVKKQKEGIKHLRKKHNKSAKPKMRHKLSKRQLRIFRIKRSLKKNRDEKQGKIIEKIAQAHEHPPKDVNVWGVLKYPHMTEKSMGMIETQNKIVFFVDRKSTKEDVKLAFEKAFNVPVESVNIELTRKNEKKAYIKLPPKHEAVEIASRLGML